METILGRSGLARRGEGSSPCFFRPGRQSQVTAVTRSLDLGYNPWRLQGKKPLAVRHRSTLFQPKNMAHDQLSKGQTISIQRGARRYGADSP